VGRELKDKLRAKPIPKARSFWWIDPKQLFERTIFDFSIAWTSHSVRGVAEALGQAIPGAWPKQRRESPR